MNGKPRIVNVVATGRFPCELDIEKLSQTLDCKERVYEPEIYPALLVKVGKKRHHLTLYSNGKYIICGAKSEEEVMEAYNKICEKLRECGYLEICVNIKGIHVCHVYMVLKKTFYRRMPNFR